MQKATKVLSIIALIFDIAMLVFLIVMGIISIAVVAPSATGGDAPVVAAITTGIVEIVLALVFIPGAIFALKIKKLNEAATPEKGKMILFGVLEIVFGFLPCGVLSIVRGAIQGK